MAALVPLALLFVWRERAAALRDQIRRLEVQP